MNATPAFHILLPDRSTAGSLSPLLLSYPPWKPAAAARWKLTGTFYPRRTVWCRAWRSEVGWSLAVPPPPAAWPSLAARSHWDSSLPSGSRYPARARPPGPSAPCPAPAQVSSRRSDQRRRVRSGQQQTVGQGRYFISLYLFWSPPPPMMERNGSKLKKILFEQDFDGTLSTFHPLVPQSIWKSYTYAVGSAADGKVRSGQQQTVRSGQLRRSGQLTMTKLGN